jgi:hypothetical protein
VSPGTQKIPLPFTHERLKVVAKISFLSSDSARPLSQPCLSHRLLPINAVNYMNRREIASRIYSSLDFSVMGFSSAPWPLWPLLRPLPKWKWLDVGLASVASSLLSAKRDKKPRFFGLGSSRPTSSKPSSAVGRGLLRASELRGGWRWCEESRDWRGRPSGGMMGERAEISCEGGISLWNSA